MVLLECLRRCVRAPRFIEHGDDDDFDGASKVRVRVRVRV